MNVLKLHLQTTIWTLLKAGSTQRQIERATGISRHTIRAYKKKFDSQSPDSCADQASTPIQTAPPWPPTQAAAPTEQLTGASTCEPYRDYVQAQLRLKRNAMAIYQDLVDQFGLPKSVPSCYRRSCTSATNCAAPSLSRQTAWSRIGANILAMQPWAAPFWIA